MSNTDMYGRRQSVSIQLGENVPPRRAEEQPEMVLDDTSHFAENNPEVMERDIRNYMNFNESSLKDVKENLELHKKNLKLIAQNPVLGDIFLSFFSKLQLMMTNEEIDEVLMLKAQVMHSIHEKTSDEGWDRQVAAHDIYIRQSPIEELPLSHHENQRRMRNIVDEQAKIRAASAAYEKAKKAFINESTYVVKEGQGEDGLARVNVFANNVLAVTEDGKTVKFNNRAIANMQLKNRQEQENLNNNNQNTPISSISDDDDMVVM